MAVRIRRKPDDVPGQAFRRVHGALMVQQANRTSISGLVDDGDHLLFTIPFADGQDHRSLRPHAIEVHRHEVRQHFREYRCEPIEL